jgi:hypothetical protein
MSHSSQHRRIYFPSFLFLHVWQELAFVGYQSQVSAAC